jgi:hypothetical protein
MCCLVNDWCAAEETRVLESRWHHLEQNTQLGVQAEEVGLMSLHGKKLPIWNVCFTAAIEA